MTAGPEDSTKDYYEQLGVPRNASDRDISAAFRSLAKIYHTDRNSTLSCDEQIRRKEIFQRLNNAKEVLLDPKLRAQYDETLEVSRTFLCMISAERM